jgi:hypothetical protein
MRCAVMTAGQHVHESDQNIGAVSIVILLKCWIVFYLEISTSQPSDACDECVLSPRDCSPADSLHLLYEMV